jgi:hypothetical protein
MPRLFFAPISALLQEGNSHSCIPLHASSSVQPWDGEEINNNVEQESDTLRGTAQCEYAEILEMYTASKPAG